MKIASIPEDWTTPVNNVERGEPSFIDVDNLGGWDLFVLRPKFKQGGNEMNYNGYYLSLGSCGR